MEQANRANGYAKPESFLKQPVETTHTSEYANKNQTCKQTGKHTNETNKKQTNKLQNAVNGK